MLYGERIKNLEIKYEELNKRYFLQEIKLTEKLEVLEKTIQTLENRFLTLENSIDEQKQSFMEKLEVLEKTIQTLENRLTLEEKQKQIRKGRETVITNEIRIRALTMSNDGMSQRHIAKMLGISVATVNKILHTKQSS